MANIITEVNQLTESKLTSHPLWRSKASYGISSLRKRTLQKNRSLSQAKFEPNLPARKDSTRKDSMVRKDSVVRKDSKANKEPASPPRKDSNPRHESPPPEPAPGKDSGGNVEAQNHAKHIAELTNLIAFKQRTRSISSALEANAPLPLPVPASQQETAKEAPPKSSKTPRESMIALPGLGTGQKLKPVPPPREKSTIGKNLLAIEQTILGPNGAPSPKIPSSDTKEVYNLANSNPYLEILDTEPKTAPNSTEEPINLSSDLPIPPTDFEIPDQTVGDLSASGSITNSLDNICAPETPTDQEGDGAQQSSLASSLVLAPDTDSGFFKLSGELEPPPEIPDATREEDLVREDSNASLSSQDTISCPSTPKPVRPTPVTFDGTRLSRPALPGSSATAFSPILLNPLSPSDIAIIPPRRKHSRAPALQLDSNQPSRQEPPYPSPLSSSPSNPASPSRWSSLFDSPKSRTASPPVDRASPMLGNMGKRLTLLNNRQPSEENVSVSPPQRIFSITGMANSAFLSQARAGRLARMSKYEKYDSSSGMRRSASTSSNSDTEGGDSFLWRQSMSSSNASQGTQLSLLPMPRSISSDAIMYIPPPPNPPLSSLLSTEGLDPEDREQLIGYYNTLTGEAWDSDIVDNEVLEIFSSRFRSLSFSCVEDLLEYGFEIDAQI